MKPSVRDMVLHSSLIYASFMVVQVSMTSKNRRSTCTCQKRKKKQPARKYRDSTARYSWATAQRQPSSGNATPRMSQKARVHSLKWYVVHLSWRRWRASEHFVVACALLGQILIFYNNTNGSERKSNEHQVQDMSPNIHDDGKEART